MRKILPAFILLLIPLNVIFAQSSPFGSLTGKESESTDAVEMQGQQVEDYVKAMEEYESLLAMYNRAYGDQRVLLEEQVIARAQDSMYSKLGAIETYLDALIKNADFYKLISASEKIILEQKLGEYRNEMGDYAQQVKDAESLNDMKTLSVNFNGYLDDFLNIKNKHIARLSAVRGLEIIRVAMAEIDLMRYHLDSAAELGHDTEATRSKFDAAMLKLERSKDVYLEVQAVTENVDILNYKETKGFVSTVVTTNREVIKAQEDLKEVVSELRTFFGQSPWNINFDKSVLDAMIEEETVSKGGLVENENSEDMEVANE